MTGPKIIEQPIDALTADGRAMRSAQPGSYIRRTNVGTWVAVYRGVFQGEYRGLGAEAKAARAAGTTTRLA